MIWRMPNTYIVKVLWISHHTNLRGRECLNSFIIYTISICVIGLYFQHHLGRALVNHLKIRALLSEQSTQVGVVINPPNLISNNCQLLNNCIMPLFYFFSWSNNPVTCNLSTSMCAFLSFACIEWHLLFNERSRSFSNSWKFLSFMNSKPYCNSQ